MKKITCFIVFSLLLHAAGICQPTWTQKADHSGAPRYDFAGFSLNGKGYIGGGRYGGAFNALSEWQVYDPASDSWNIASPMPGPYTGLTAFAINGYGYVANGVNDATYNYETYKYNQAGNNWSTVASNSYPRLYASAVSNDNYGYVIGGYGYMAEAMNDVWEYNSITDAWNEKAALPANAARYNATAFAINGEIFLFGGTDGVNVLNDLWKYNPSTNQWMQKSPMPAAGREYCLSFMISNIAYVIGGSSYNGSLKEVWKYHAGSDAWTQLPDFPGTNAPIGGVGFTIDSKGYIVCANGTSECWEFDPGTVGVEAGPEPAKISLYPNPVVNKSVIDMSGKPDGTFQLDIYSSLGQSIKSYKTIHSQLVIENNDFDKGLYFIKINDGSTESETIKFIIK